MGVILGIDIGGSSTKIVGLHENGAVIDMLRVKAEDPLTSLYGALGNFLATHSLKLTDIGHIALTPAWAPRMWTATFTACARSRSRSSPPSAWAVWR